MEEISDLIAVGFSDQC